MVLKSPLHGANCALPLSRRLLFLFRMVESRLSLPFLPFRQGLNRQALQALPWPRYPHLHALDELLLNGASMFLKIAPAVCQIFVHETMGRQWTMQGNDSKLQSNQWSG